MILPTKVAFALGVVLACLAALVQALHLSQAWQDGLTVVILAAGVFGVQLVSPQAIFAKLPLHVAEALQSVLGVLLILQRSALSLPHGVHAVIAAVIVLIGTLGINVVRIDASHRLRVRSPRV